MRTTTILVTMVCMALACRSTRTAGRHADQFVAGPSVAGGIGCDVCAIYFVTDASVIDATGVGVQSAQIWFVPQVPRLLKDGPAPPPRRAHLLGTTDAQGSLKAPECYMDGSEYRFTPPKDLVRFEFLVLREGLGARRVVIDKSSAEVLFTGLVLDTPLRDPLAFGYRLPLEVSLSPVLL